MKKGRGKSGRNEGGERRAEFIPPFFHPQLSRRFFFEFTLIGRFIGNDFLVMLQEILIAQGVLMTKILVA